MRWTWRLGRVFGIETRMHVTMALLALYVGAQGVDMTGAWTGGALSVAALCVVFTSVLLHELGHALMARRFGIQTRAITLSPLGGIASLEGLPQTPGQELRVALAGPAVNVVLVGAALAVRAVLDVAGVNLGTGALLLDTAVWGNVALAVFNMLPAFPMDGGRVLRAVIERRRGRLVATERTARIGAFLALALGVWAAWQGQWLSVFVAFFVWRLGQHELAMVRRRHGPEAGSWPSQHPPRDARIFGSGGSGGPRRNTAGEARIVDVPLIEG